jgi:hypothetical protein
MAYESPLRAFRDMEKNPDLYVDQASALFEASRPLSEDKQEIITSPGHDFKAVVSLIKDASLLPKFADNKLEADLLHQRQETVLRFLFKILEDVKNYLTQVNILRQQKNENYNDQNNYQDVIGSSDTLRRSLHNILIRDIKITARLINLNFNADYPEKMRLIEEAKMPERQGITPALLQELMRQRAYYKFPLSGGAFIDLSKMPRDPIGEREYIADWALRIYTDLSALTDDLRASSKR